MISDADFATYQKIHVFVQAPTLLGAISHLAACLASKQFQIITLNEVFSVHRYLQLFIINLLKTIFKVNYIKN
jgi:hypothetical protein